MEKTSILFIVHTEYHMLVTISLIADLYSDENKYDIWIVQTIEENSGRFKFPKVFPAFGHIRYDVVPYNEHLLKHDEGFRGYYDTICATNITHCIIFNKLSFISFITVQELSKRGSRIILAPDGAAAYTRITWFTPRWSLLVYANTLRFLWANHVREIFFFWPTLVYGRMKEIDEVWVQYPRFVDNRAGKIVKEIAIMESKKSIAASKSYFGYESQQFGPCLFYTNQPFRNQVIYDFEIAVLKQLRNNFPNRKLVIKLHPSSEQAQIDRFENLGNVTCLTTTLPAECFIADLHDSLVLSFWSTSLLLRNSSCRYYWLYPMLEKRGLMLKKVSLVNPTDHINLVSEVEEIL